MISLESACAMDVYILLHEFLGRGNCPFYVQLGILHIINDPT